MCGQGSSQKTPSHQMGRFLRAVREDFLPGSRFTACAGMADQHERRLSTWRTHDVCTLTDSINVSQSRVICDLGAVEDLTAVATTVSAIGEYTVAVGSAIQIRNEVGPISAIGESTVAVGSATQIRNEVGPRGDVLGRSADRHNNLRENGCWSWFETRCQRERVGKKPQAHSEKTWQFHLTPFRSFCTYAASIGTSQSPRVISWQSSALERPPPGSPRPG